MFEICQSKLYVYSYYLPCILIWQFRVLVLIKINYCPDLFITPLKSSIHPHGGMDRRVLAVLTNKPARGAENVELERS